LADSPRPPRGTGAPICANFLLSLLKALVAHFE
jgi:hypothetical protein